MIYIILLFLQFVLLYFLSKRVQANISRFFYQVTKSRKFTIYLMAVLFLPGTFIHEISHFLAALFLLVPVGELELIPKFQGDTVKMGSVSIGKADPIRRFIIGIAPFILGTILMLATMYFVSMIRIIDTWWKILITGYLVFTVGNSMFASKKDLEGALELFIFLLFIFTALYILGISFPIIDAKALLSNEVVELVKRANVFLAVPIVIDLLLIYILK